MAKDVAVKPGKYVVYTAMKDEKEFDMRVAFLMAVHADYAKSLNSGWEPYECCVGIDSGQCGIFDDTVFPSDEASRSGYRNAKLFIDECSKLTLGKNQSGILKSRKGVVSVSGYGDDSYELLCQYHDGERVALMIDYTLEKNSAIIRELMNSQCDEQQAV